MISTTGRAKTGLITTGCYAESLRDCDGGPLSREHYISKALLERFGDGFIVDGLSWLRAPRKSSAKELQAKVLCARHNSALSPLDATIARLCDVLVAAHKSENVGTHVFDGEEIERWTVKALLGLAMSGNLRFRDGRQARARQLPDLFLQVLFAEAPMPQGCGFFYVGDPIEDVDSGLLDIVVNHYPLDHPKAGEMFGATIKLLGFQFITSVGARIEVGRQRLCYRPAEFRLGTPERGRIVLQWRQPSQVGIVLDLVAPLKRGVGGNGETAAPNLARHVGAAQ